MSTYLSTINNNSMLNARNNTISSDNNNNKNNMLDVRNNIIPILPSKCNWNTASTKTLTDNGNCEIHTNRQLWPKQLQLQQWQLQNAKKFNVHNNTLFVKRPQKQQQHLVERHLHLPAQPYNNTDVWTLEREKVRVGDTGRRRTTSRPIITIRKLAMTMLDARARARDNTINTAAAAGKK